MTPELVVWGNLLVDDLVFPDGCTRMGQPGGAVLYAVLAARLWELRAGAVSIAGEDYPAAMLETLRARGVDLAGLRTLDRPGIRAWLLYEGRVRRIVHRLGAPSHASVSPMPSDLPPGWDAAPVHHLAPMPLGHQHAILAHLAARPERFVSVDPHEPVTEATLPAWREALAHADAFFPSEDEMQLADAATDPRAALLRLVHGRLRFVGFKRGLRGGILYDALERRFHEWAPRTEGTADPTGAGDAFALGFVSAHHEGLPVAVCLERAVVTASFALEAWGPEGLLAGTRADAAGRWHRWYGEEARR
jgi:sugar/nucleoside kinase (ribokinase family)